MSLAIDTSRAFRFPDELAGLVTVVVQHAGDYEETNWLEWKAGLDLTSEAAFCHLPHTVLGFANRDPEVAAQHAEGFAYLIIGAEPGDVSGVTPIDSGDMSSKLRSYMGDTIRWHAAYVDTDGKKVLVLSVEPPRPGDPIHTLRKKLRNHPPGQIFVRLHGQSVIASPDHIEMLSKRLTSGNHIGDVQVSLADDDGIAAVPDVQLLLRQWRDQEAGQRSRPVKHATANEQEASVPRVYTDIMTRAMEAAQAFGSFDTRSPEQYDEELAQYLDRAEEALTARAVHLHSRGERGCLRLVLANHTQKVFRQVQVRAQVDPAADLVSEDTWPCMPSPPKDWGAFVPNIPGYYEPSASLTLSTSMIQPHAYEALAPRPQLTHNGNGVAIRYPPMDLRPGEQTVLDPVGLRPLVAPGAEVAITWSVTAFNTDGHRQGTLHLPVVANQIYLSCLTEDPAPDID